MKLELDDYEIELIDEPTYSPGSADNVREYANIYRRVDNDQPTCVHGVVVRSGLEHLGSAVLLGNGGPTSLHENSLAVEGPILYVAVGDSLFSLSLPTIELNWVIRADEASCFGVYVLRDPSRLVTWGELEIACFSREGKALWRTSGPDIFTGGLIHGDEFVRVKDFSGNVHIIDLNSGEMIDENNKRTR